MEKEKEKEAAMETKEEGFLQSTKMFVLFHVRVSENKSNSMYAMYIVVIVPKNGKSRPEIKTE